MTDTVPVSRELLRQVLRGLRMCDQQNQVLDDTYTALRAALEQPAPVQDTTGYMNAGQVHEMQQWRAPYAYVYPKSEAGARIAIYTAPQPDRIAQLEAANTNLFEQGQKMHKRIQELESDCKIGAQEMVKAYEEIDNLKAQVSHQEPVAWCQLGLDGKSIAYFDGKPMIMTGHVGNEHHPTPLFTAQPQRFAGKDVKLSYQEAMELVPIPLQHFTDGVLLQFVGAIEAAVWEKLGV